MYLFIGCIFAVGFAGIYFTYMPDYDHHSTSVMRPNFVLGSVIESEFGKTLTYDTFGNRPVQIVIGRDSNVTIRIAMTNVPPSVPYLEKNYLKYEVEKFVNAGKPVRLGTTGYYLHFASGHPKWQIKFHQSPIEGDFRGITFGEQADITNRTIIVRGIPNMVPGGDPYTVRVR